MRKYVLAGFIVLTRSLGHLVQKLRVAGVFLPPAFFYWGEGNIQPQHTRFSIVSAREKPSSLGDRPSRL